MKRFVTWLNGSPYHESADALVDTAKERPIVLGNEFDMEALADLLNEWEDRISRTEAPHIIAKAQLGVDETAVTHAGACLGSGVQCDCGTCERARVGERQRLATRLDQLADGLRKGEPR